MKIHSRHAFGPFRDEGKMTKPMHIYEPRDLEVRNKGQRTLPNAVCSGAYIAIHLFWLSHNKPPRLSQIYYGYNKQTNKSIRIQICEENIFPVINTRSRYNINCDRQDTPRAFPLDKTKGLSWVTRAFTTAINTIYPIFRWLICPKVL